MKGKYFRFSNGNIRAAKKECRIVRPSFGSGLIFHSIENKAFYVPLDNQKYFSAEVSW